MNGQDETDDFNLIDFYNFLKDGWKIIAGGIVTGASIGVLTAFLIPEKFHAGATIEPARVMGANVETINVLAEKMRSPTYYSPLTVSACDIKDRFDPTAILAKDLKPEIRKQSAFVSISYKSSSLDTSISCLEAVLTDVKRNQDLIVKSQLEKANRDLNLALQRLDTLKIKQAQELDHNKERLELTKQKLATAQKFINDFEKNSVRLDFKDEKFSASSLFLATVLSKQTEVKNLQLEINDLNMKVSASLTSHDNEILNLENHIASLEQSLLPPATTQAKFAVPIVASPIKVEPKRSLITAIGLVGGGIFGVTLLLIRRALRQIKMHKQALAISNA